MSGNAFYKQMRFLAEDLRHPSLHAKKYDEAQKSVASSRIQARTGGSYFIIEGDSCIVLDLIPHPK